MEESLLIKTKDLFKSRPHYITLKKIAEDTGISEPWLATFYKSENPGIKYVEDLYTYLTNIKN